jgi:hypothetical protein
LLADHDPGDRIKIVWIDQAGSEQAVTVVLGCQSGGLIGMDARLSIIKQRDQEYEPV